MSQYQIGEQVLQALHEVMPSTCYKNGDQWVLLNEVLYDASGVIVVDSVDEKKYYVLVAFGEARFLKDWARDERCQVSHVTLLKRIKNGESAVSAITRPPSIGDPSPHRVSDRIGWDKLSNFEKACLDARSLGMAYRDIAIELSKGRETPVDYKRVNKALYSARLKTGHESTAELVAAWLESERVA